MKKLKQVEKSKVISFRVDRDLFERLERQATETGTSVSVYAKRILGFERLINDMTVEQLSEKLDGIKKQLEINKVNIRALSRRIEELEKEKIST